MPDHDSYHCKPSARSGATITFTEEQLENMLDRVSKRAAREALIELGLSDDAARNDIREMRSLMSAFRETRSTFWKMAVQMGSMALIGFISLAVWSHFKHQIN